MVAPVPPQPCFLSHLFAVPRPDNRPPPSHHRLVPTIPVHLRPLIHSGQPHSPGTPPDIPGVPRHARHLRGVYPYPDAAQSLPIPRLLVPGPAVLFSRPSLRPQCRSVYFYAGPHVASPLPAGQRDFPSRLLGRHCHLAPGSRHVTSPGTAGYGVSAGYGFPTQPREVTTISFSVGGLAGRPLVASDRPLASSSRGSRSDPSHGSGSPSGPPGHPQTDRAVGGSHQLRVPGPPVPATLPPTTHEGRYDCQSCRTRHTDATPSSHSRGLDILDIPDTVVACSHVPLRYPVPLPLDGCFASRVGCLAVTVAHGIGSVVASRTLPPCQHSGATGCPPRPAIF